MKKLPSFFKALIFDLDGVITQTEELHIRAWKQMFDQFLAEHTAKNNFTIMSLDPHYDYRTFIDGRSRYEGAQAFLQSRNIVIPFGSPSDYPEQTTICGLANKKNQIYLSLLKIEGAKVYPDTIESMKCWRDLNKKIAAISASRNCREILSSAGIAGYFDVIVDGVDAEVNSLRSKPNPDIFVFAAKLLNIAPSEIVIFEDSTAGVTAGKEGGFARVVGVSRNGTSSMLYASGADIVVSKITELIDISDYAKAPGLLGSALQNSVTIGQWIASKNQLLLLDYDGTVTPIVEQPQLATISNKMHNVIESLAKFMNVALVSGRGIENIKGMARLNNVYYAGSHGFEIEGPFISMDPIVTPEQTDEINRAERLARSRLQNVNGVLFERKKYSFAIHYRNATDSDSNIVLSTIHQIKDEYKLIKVALGKKVVELRPNIDWDKGKAIVFIAEKIYKKAQCAFPLYIGDDFTDEDAFRQVKRWGISILVGDHGQKTFADYSLVDPEEVYLFLSKILAIKSNRESIT